MAKRSDIAQNAKVISTGAAATATLLITAFLGLENQASETLAASAAPIASAPTVLAPEANLATTEQPTPLPPSTETSTITAGAATPPRIVGTSSQAATSQAPVVAPTAAPAAPVTTAAPLTVAPQPIVVAVPTTQTLQAPPTTSSR